MKLIWPSGKALGRETLWPSGKALGCQTLWPSGKALGCETVWPSCKVLGYETVWPSGKALRLVSRSTSVRFPFDSPLPSKIVVFGHHFVTLSLTVSETLKCLSPLPFLMQDSFWWWRCSDRYKLPRPLPPGISGPANTPSETIRRWTNLTN